MRRIDVQLKASLKASISITTLLILAQTLVVFQPWPTSVVIVASGCVWLYCIELLRLHAWLLDAESVVRVEHDPTGHSVQCSLRNGGVQTYSKVRFQSLGWCVLIHCSDGQNNNAPQRKYAATPKKRTLTVFTDQCIDHYQLRIMAQWGSS